MSETTNKSKPTAPRARSRRTAAWKSGLVATGLGAVVLGASYFAGLSTPVVNAAQATAGSQAAQPAVSDQAPNLSADNSQSFAFNDDGNRAREFTRRRSLELENGDSAPTFSQRQPRFFGPITRSRGS